MLRQNEAIFLLLLLLSLVAAVSVTAAFVVLPPSRPNQRQFTAAAGSGGNNLNGRRRGGGGGGGDDGGDGSSSSSFEEPLFSSLHYENETDVQWMVRGGDGKKTSAAENVVKGAQATLSSAASFWANAFGSLGSNLIGKPINKVKSTIGNLMTSKEQKRQDALLEQLQTMPVRRVTVPNSTVLPQDVIQIAAKRSGVLGNPLRTDRVQDLALSLKRWYQRRGYVLHGVTGATLKPETGTAEITVQEPISSQVPVGITYCKEMVIDPETEELLTFRQYKEKHAARKTVDKKQLNTTYVTTDKGRTNPRKIASALKLRPGNPFLWDAAKWKRIVQSGIFSRVLSTSPQPLQDGSVQLQIFAVEAPLRHLEYGVGRSLYTGSWEGELQLEHGNLLGGGESLGVTVRRGARHAQPSVRVGFSDGRFGIAGGYDVEVFSDYLGSSQQNKNVSAQDSGTVNDDLVLRDRRGAMLRIRNPVSQNVMQHSMASVSVERAATETGWHEHVASTTLQVGPFVRELPFDARSDLDVKVATGTRMVVSGSGGAAEQESKESADAAASNPLDLASHLNHMIAGKSLSPFASATVSTRQIFPLFTTSFGSSSPAPPLTLPSPKNPPLAVGAGGATTTANTRGGPPRWVTLAWLHSLTTSSRSLPKHQAIAQGYANSIRGYPDNGPVSSALRGTTELRIPVQLPERLKQSQDGSVVVFFDWLVASPETASPFFRKYAFGVGFRKSVQGLPLKFDITYSKESKFKTSFGLGRDFDV